MSPREFVPGDQGVVSILLSMTICLQHLSVQIPSFQITVRNFPAALLDLCQLHQYAKSSPTCIPAAKREGRGLVNLLDAEETLYCRAQRNAYLLLAKDDRARVPAADVSHEVWNQNPSRYSRRRRCS